MLLCWVHYLAIQCFKQVHGHTLPCLAHTIDPGTCSFTLSPPSTAQPKKQESNQKPSKVASPPVSNNLALDPTLSFLASRRHRCQILICSLSLVGVAWRPLASSASPIQSAASASASAVTPQQQHQRRSVTAMASVSELQSTPGVCASPDPATKVCAGPNQLSDQPACNAQCNTNTATHHCALLSLPPSNYTLQCAHPHLHMHTCTHRTLSSSRQCCASRTPSPRSTFTRACWA